MSRVKKYNNEKSYSNNQTGVGLINIQGNKNRIKKFIIEKKRNSFIMGLFSGLLINLLWYIIQHCFL